MSGEHLDLAIEQAKELLETSLRDAPASSRSEFEIRVENAGNVAHSIHVNQQTQHIGKN